MESTIDFVDSPQAQSAIKGIKRDPRILRRVLQEIISSESDESDDLDKESTLKQLPALDIYTNDEAPNMSSSKPKIIVEGATALVPGSKEDADDENSDEEGDDAIESKQAMEVCTPDTPSSAQRAYSDSDKRQLPASESCRCIWYTTSFPVNSLHAGKIATLWRSTGCWSRTI